MVGPRSTFTCRRCSHSLAAAVAAGIGATMIGGPLAGLAAGVAAGVGTYAALSGTYRYEVGGESVGASALGGFGDATGIGGVYAGLTNQDFGTFKNLNLTAGQRWFAGLMGVTQLGLLGAGSWAAWTTPGAESAAGAVEWASPGAEATGATAGSINFMNGDQAFLAYASLRSDVDPNGLLDVIAHGDAISIQVGDNSVNAAEAATLIRQSPQFAGQGIRLLSCSTGSVEGGFAQQLADALGVTVYAPNDYLWANADGSMTIGPGA